MTTAVTVDLLHRLVSASHAEGITALGVQAVITRNDTFVLFLTEDNGDFIDDSWQLPGGTVLPGQTLTDALFPALAAIGLHLDEVTDYLGHDDDGGNPVMRTFRFAITVTDPDAICHSGRLAHWWAGVDDGPGHCGGERATSTTIGEPSTSADGGNRPLLR